jgi:hypothetical protein
MGKRLILQVFASYWLATPPENPNYATNQDGTLVHK